MRFLKSFSLLISLGVIAALVACGGSSHKSQPITVTLSTVPTSLQVRATQTITATVANDSANGGVTWSCTPGNSAATCGSFSSTTTASGVAVTYTAPATVPASTVVITATSVTNNTISASTAAITITPAPVIAVTITSPATFPAALFVNDTLSVTATVANDSSNGGVIWSCTPGNSAATCGSFSSGANAVASGTASTYTAPATAVGAVTLTATSVTDNTKSASSPSITINASSGITVSLSTPPPSSMATSATATIAATTTDTAGVNWSCTPVGACGSFSPTTTLSTATTTYTAPAAAGAVTVTATSVTDNAINASVAVTITTAVSSPLPDGNYVYSLAGTDNVDFSVFDVAGVFTIAGGVITGGEQDFIDFDFALTDSINPTGSSVVTTADGNLLITLVTCNATDCTATDPNVGVAGVETLNGALISASKARITEFDASASASGTLKLQTSTSATFPESYAFTVSGIDTNSVALAIGGIINVDGTSGTISGKGSIFDANDGFSGITFQGETFGAGSVSAPDAFGRMVFTLNPTDSIDFPQILLVGYIVDNTHIRLVQTNDASMATTGGEALSQGANTGTFGSTSVSGNSYVAGVSGFDTNGVLQAAALITLNSGGTVAGTINGNDLTGGAGITPTPITAGTYTVDSTGRVTLTGVTGAGGAINTNLQLYLDGSGDVLAISLDTGDELAGVGSQQTGGGAFTAANLSGTYVLSATGADLNFGDELDAAGQVSADGVGILGATVGYIDLNWLLDPSPGPVFTDAPVTGTFTADPSGVFTGTITGLDVTSCPAYTGKATTCTADTFAFYLLDASGDAVVIETDSNQLTLGLFDLQ